MRLNAACNVCDTATTILTDEWYAYHNTDWVQSIILGEATLTDECEVPKDAAGNYVYTRRDITDHVFYVWSQEQINGEPIIKLHSGVGGGIEVDLAQSALRLHLTPSQVAALDPRVYTLFLYDRASAAVALGQPILRATLTICEGHTWFDEASAPPNAAGTTLPPVEAVAVVSALNTREVVLVAGQQVFGAGAALAAQIIPGVGPPLATVGRAGDWYVDLAAGALYPPRDAITGWSADPIIKPQSLQDVLDVGNTAAIDIVFVNRQSGVVLPAENGDNTRITMADNGAIIGDDL